MHNRLVTAAALLAGATLAFGGLSAEAAAPAGTVVLARVGHSPVLIWDATPAVIDIVRQKTQDATALKTLEKQAADIDAQRLKQMPAAAQVTVRVIYQRTGAVSPVYGSPTFAGVEQLLNVTLRRGQAESAAQVNVTGKLPPH